MWWSHYNTWLICKLVFGALEGVRPQYLTSLWPLWGGMLVLENSLISLKNVKEKRQGRTRKPCFPQVSPTSPETSFHPEDGADSGLSCYCWHMNRQSQTPRDQWGLLHMTWTSPVVWVFYFESCFSQRFSLLPELIANRYTQSGACLRAEVCQSSVYELGQANRPKCQSRILLGNKMCKMCCLGQNSEAQLGKTINHIKLNL